MRYFVVSEDGGKFGPAEVPLLNQWIEEGRLLPEMHLQEDGTNHRVIAASVLGLDFNEHGEAPVGRAPVMAMERETAVASPVSDLALAFSMVVVTLCLAPVQVVLGYLGIFTAILGCMASLKAKERMDSLGGPALILNLLAFTVWLAVHLMVGLR